MRANEQGVLENSRIYMHVATPRAQRLFFFPLCTGHFFCDETYKVERLSYNSFLLLYVLHGSGIIRHGGKESVLSQGSLAFIDCYEPHHYYTDSGWEILWLHFDGQMAREYYTEITSLHSMLFHADSEMRIRKNMEGIFHTFHDSRKSVDEAVLSNRINNILTALFTYNPAVHTAGDIPHPLKDTLFFISEHLAEPLPVDMLAARIFLSKYHFIRLFKKEFGYTPHEYILMNRINASMLALKSTSLSVKDIGFNFGFTSESSFCTAFKRLTGLTPQAYRKAR